MRTAQQTTLIEVIKNVHDFDEDNDIYHTIYLEKGSDWRPDSPAIVVEHDVEEDNSMEVANFSYFLEINLIQEMADDWANEGKSHTTLDFCELVIHYAIYDA